MFFAFWNFFYKILRIYIPVLHTIVLSKSNKSNFVSCGNPRKYINLNQQIKQFSVRSQFTNWHRLSNFTLKCHIFLHKIITSALSHFAIIIPPFPWNRNNTKNMQSTKVWFIVLLIHYYILSLCIHMICTVFKLYVKINPEFNSLKNS